MRSWRSRNFANICWAATVLPATLSFAAQCGGNTNLTYCGAGLPDTFCCESGSICLQLFNVLTPSALCCPNGLSCEQLNTISCNTTIQANPAAPAHMLDTTVPLGQCGPQCCPLGYNCQFGLNMNAYSCVMKNSTRSGNPPDPPSSSQPGTSTVASATTAIVTISYTSTVVITTTSPPQTPSTSSSITSSTATPASGGFSGQPLSQSEPSASTFPTVAILATLFPAIAVGVILVLLVIFLKRRRERQRKLVRGEEIFGGPTPPSSRGGLQISSPINRQDMAARTDFIHKRSASESSIPPSASSPMRNVIQASQNLRRTLSSGGTLVPTTSTAGQKTPTISLGPIFETPTRPKRTSQGRVRAIFSSNESSRTKTLPASKYPSINPTRLTLSRSGASQETIDVLMRPAPHDFDSFASPAESPYQIGPVTPETTYSDVYRAAGISPTKAEARGQQRSRSRSDTMSTLGDISESDREINVRFKF
ncbi:hypothetical protein E2P81_ATG00452 [Venturia nashicola]|nr:hypothetical protein E2P81_ATG00452 [Venturia nashicola]